MTMTAFDNGRFADKDIDNRSEADTGPTNARTNDGHGGPSESDVGIARPVDQGIYERAIAHDTRTVRICTLVLIVLGVVLLLLLWAIAGLAMRAGLLPYFDIGYGWFDKNIFLFFGLG